MPNVKRDGGSRFWSIFLILFLAMSFFSVLGFYDKNYYGVDDSVSGMAILSSGGVTTFIETMLEVVRDIGKPFFTLLGEDSEGIFMRVILLIILYLIISSVMRSKTGKNIGLDEKASNLIAFLISLIGVTFLPKDIVLNMGRTFSSVLVSVLILFGFKFIYDIDKDGKDGFTRWKKIFFSFLMILSILLIMSWSEGIPGFGGDSIFGIIAGIGIGIAFALIVYYLTVYGRIKKDKPPKYPPGGSTPTTTPGPTPTTTPGPTPTTTPGPTPTTTPGPGKAAIIKNVKDFYSNMKSCNRNIELEFGRGSPSQRTIQANLIRMFDFCRQLIVELDNPAAIGVGLDETLRRRIVSMGRSINTRIDKILKTTDFIKWRGLYLGWIGTTTGVLESMGPPIRGL
ncbi:MAG: hypothetical protein KJ674_03845 [Nanoarchaeota archaeon]|nr:hypothetical protein [Nanoarchaeota archaeon]